MLEVVAKIPRGKVMTYGDVAEYLGAGSARTVGMVMAKHGHEVCWHRVLRASGEPFHGGLALLAAEGVPLRGERVVLSQARWDGRSLGD